MIACLDTNAYSDWTRKLAWLKTVSSAELVLIPAVVLGELREGFLGGGLRNKIEKTLNEVLSAPAVRVLHVLEKTSEIYAELKFYLRQMGTPIPTNDIWIAASCIEHGAVLLTRDKHFEKLPQVRVKWAEG